MERGNIMSMWKSVRAFSNTDEIMDSLCSGMYQIENSALPIDNYHAALLDTEVRYFHDRDDFKKWVDDINIPHYAKFWIEE